MHFWKSGNEKRSNGCGMDFSGVDFVRCNCEGGSELVASELLSGAL